VGVRVAAGRTAAVLARGELAGTLIGALARERDPAAGAELVRDLLHLFGDQDLPIVEQQSARLGAPARLGLVEWLARTHPDRFRERLPEFAADTAHAITIARFVSIAAWQHPDQADSVRRAWMAVATPGTWESVLRDAYAGAEIGSASAPLLLDALHASAPHVREETIWFILEALAASQKIASEITAAAGEARPDAPAWEAFGRELIARHGRPPSGTDRHELLETEGSAHRAQLSAIAGDPSLTGAERGAILAIVSAAHDPFVDVERAAAPARTMTALVPGVVTAMLKAANCRVHTAIAQALVTYSADGMPGSVTIDPEGLSGECQQAWAALARTAIADTTEPVGSSPQRVMLPLNDDFLACMAAPSRAPEVDGPSAPISARRITAPRKTKDVRPEYPIEAQKRRIQGVVIIEATISPEGCVSEARVLRSLPYLDAPAVTAVSAWRFTPTLLDGVPVPVIMTVTVNFALQ
jgi:TonB family protein